MIEVCHRNVLQQAAPTGFNTLFHGCTECIKFCKGNIDAFLRVAGLMVLVGHRLGEVREGIPYFGGFGVAETDNIECVLIQFLLHEVVQLAFHGDLALGFPVFAIVFVKARGQRDLEEQVTAYFVFIATDLLNSLVVVLSFHEQQHFVIPDGIEKDEEQEEKTEKPFHWWVGL